MIHNLVLVNFLHQNLQFGHFGLSQETIIFSHFICLVAFQALATWLLCILSFQCLRMLFFCMVAFYVVAMTQECLFMVALQGLFVCPFCMGHYNASPYSPSVCGITMPTHMPLLYGGITMPMHMPLLYGGITMPIHMPLLYVALQCLSICPSCMWHYNAYPYAPSLCGITMPIHMPLLYGGITMPIHMPLLYVALQCLSICPFCMVALQCLSICPFFMWHHND